MLVFSVRMVESFYVGEARSQWKGNEPQVRIERERKRRKDRERENDEQDNGTGSCGPDIRCSGFWDVGHLLTNRPIGTEDGGRANSAERSQKMQMAL
jgi:hypothetical protein